MRRTSYSRRIGSRTWFRMGMSKEDKERELLIGQLRSALAAGAPWDRNMLEWARVAPIGELRKWMDGGAK